MRPNTKQSCIAFSGSRRVASGAISIVAVKVKRQLEKHPDSTCLVFDETTSRQVELDLRGTEEDVLRRLAQAETPEDPEKAGVGRPKLGVVAREVTLLPRHWEWLALHPGGASAALRRLVEDAKIRNRARDEARRSQEAVHRFMTAVAGNLPHFEEALRALYANERTRFDSRIALWPRHVREHVKNLSRTAFRSATAAQSSAGPNP